jgi:hypothetical protein
MRIRNAIALCSSALLLALAGCSRDSDPAAEQNAAAAESSRAANVAAGDDGCKLAVQLYSFRNDLRL